MSVIEHVKAVAEQKQTAGADAQGFALAQSAIAMAKGDGQSWVRYVGRLIEFSVEARTAFMREVRKHTKEMTEHVKASGEHADAYAKMSRSARTRLSELSTIAKALNAGMDIACKTNERGVLVRDAHSVMQPVDPFYAIVGYARTFDMSTASKAGRKPDPWLVKLAKWLEKNKPEDTDTEAQEVATQTAKILAKHIKTTA